MKACYKQISKANNLSLTKRGEERRGVPPEPGNRRMIRRACRGIEHLVEMSLELEGVSHVKK